MSNTEATLLQEACAMLKSYDAMEVYRPLRETLGYKLKDQEEIQTIMDVWSEANSKQSEKVRTAIRFLKALMADNPIK